MIVILQGHTDTVMSAAFSPDGRTLATGGDWTVRLWDVRTGKEISKHRGDSRVYSVSFSPDGNSIAVGEAEGPVRLWDIASGRCTATLEGRHPVAFSPDGKVLASGSETDDTILLWNLHGNVAQVTHGGCQVMTPGVGSTDLTYRAPRLPILRRFFKVR